MDLEALNQLTERYRSIKDPMRTYQEQSSSCREEIKEIEHTLTDMMVRSGRSDIETNGFVIKLRSKQRIARLDQAMLFEVLSEVYGDNVQAINEFMEKVEAKKRARTTTDRILKIIPK